MHPPESGHVVKNLCHDNRLWRLRKPFSCLAHGRVPAAVRFQGEEAKLRMVFWERLQEERGDVDQEQREVRCLGHRRWRSVHNIRQPPIRLGIPDVKLDLQAKAVIINALCIASIDVATPQHHVGTCRRLPMGLDHDNHMQGRRKLFVPHRCLRDVRLDVVIDGRPLQVLAGEVGRVQCAAVLATWSPASIRTFIWERQRGIMASLGKQLSAKAAHHVPGRVVAEVAIQHGRLHRHNAVDHREVRLNHRVNPWPCGAPDQAGLLALLAAFGATRRAFVGRVLQVGDGLLGVGSCCSFFRLRAAPVHHLYRIRASRVEAHHGHGQDGTPGHRLAVHGREKTVHAIRLLA